MLDIRNGTVLDAINLISRTGNLHHQEVLFEETQEGYRISAVYEDPSAKPKKVIRFSSRLEEEPFADLSGQSKERKKSIVLDLDEDEELTHIVLSHELGNIDIDIERNS